MKLAALISGGKDSCMAIWKAMQQGHSIEVLIAMESKNKESYMFHTPKIELTKLQAKAMNIPLIYKKTKGEKEKELIDLKKAILKAKKKYTIEGVVSGALASNYQRERIEKICKELELKSITPLWHIDPEEYLDELIKNKFEFIITAVAADGLDESWIGRTMDKKAVEELKKLARKYRFSCVGEGGEYETATLYSPVFNKRIKITNLKKTKEKILLRRN